MGITMQRIMDYLIRNIGITIALSSVLVACLVGFFSNNKWAKRLSGIICIALIILFVRGFFVYNSNPSQDEDVAQGTIQESGDDSIHSNSVEQKDDSKGYQDEDTHKNSEQKEEAATTDTQEDTEPQGEITTIATSDNSEQQETTTTTDTSNDSRHKGESLNTINSAYKTEIDSLQDLIPINGSLATDGTWLMTSKEEIISRSDVLLQN